MDPTKAWYKRYWEPNLLQTVGFSLVAGTVATTLTHPIQYIKTVIQFRSQGVGIQGDKYKAWTLGYNPFRIMRQMHSRGGGLMQFYGGFEANLVGRLSYLAIRNSIYKIIYDLQKPQKVTNDLTDKEKMIIAGFSGGVAALATNPFTLISIRQILDSQIKPQWRRNYGKLGNAFSALGDAKFRGSFENVVRHVFLNISLTAPYNYFHESLYIKFGDYGFVEPIALALAAAVSTFVVLPFDTARTRVMQFQDQGERNRILNPNLKSVLINSIKYEKTPFALFAGYWTYYMYTLMYATLTIGVTNRMCDSIKRSKGLKQNQI